jgi:hypothetical protein
VTSRIFTFIVVGVALTAAAYFGFENRRLQIELQQLRTEIRAVRATEAAWSARDSSLSLATVHDRPTTASERRAAPKPEPSAEEVASAALAELASQTNDPAWQAEHFNEAILRVESRYGKFFSSLQGWPPEKLERLKRQLALQEVALLRASLPDKNLTPEAAAEASSEALQRAIEDQQKSLRDIMGDADLARFDQFTNAEKYRSAVGDITNAMRSKGLKVNSEVEDSIVVAYAQAMRGAALEIGGQNISQLNPQQRAELKQRQQQAFQIQLMKQLSGVLDPQQLNTFMESQLEQQGSAR